MPKSRAETADAQVALRLPQSLLDRADALAERMASNPKVTVLGRITRSAILKLAIERGMDSLEREHR